MTPHTQTDAPSIPRPARGSDRLAAEVRLYGLLSQDAAFAHHRTQLEYPGLSGDRSQITRRSPRGASRIRQSGTPTDGPNGAEDFGVAHNVLFAQALGLEYLGEYAIYSGQLCRGNRIR